jgi:hypothetical protein
MKITSKLAPDFHTVFGIQFFRKNQTTTSEGLIGADWIRITENSQLPFIYHHLQKGASLEVKKANHFPANGKIFLFYRDFFIGELNSGFCNIIADALLQGKKIVARISQLEKETFMPTKNIKVEFFKK